LRKDTNKIRIME